MKEVPVWNTKRITERKMDSRKEEPTLISEVEGAALQRDMSGLCMCVLYLQGPSETAVSIRDVFVSIYKCCQPS